MPAQPSPDELARQQFMDNVPTYQRYDAMKLVREAARMLRRDGEKVIYRDAFRWKDDSDDRVLCNHYEMFCLESIANDFGYEIVHDFNHVAVIK